MTFFSAAFYCSPLQSVTQLQTDCPTWDQKTKNAIFIACIGPFHVHVIHGFILSILSQPREPYPPILEHQTKGTAQLKWGSFSFFNNVLCTCFIKRCWKQRKPWSKRPSSQSRDTSECLWNQIAEKNIWIVVNTYLIYLISTTSHIDTFQVHRAPDNYYY